MKTEWRHRLVFSVTPKKQSLPIAVKTYESFLSLPNFAWFSYFWLYILSLILSLPIYLYLSYQLREIMGQSIDRSRRSITGAI